MAQAGFTPIKLYLSTTAAAVPTAANLEPGELALNNNDGKLYYEDSAGVVQVLASKAAAAGVTSFTAGTTGLTPSTATSGAVTLAGTLAIANGGTGLTALGTGVQTAIGVNVGTAGAVVVNGGALGTPSSGTVTNLTGTASINVNGTVGATTANTGAFTTLSATGVTTLAAGTLGAPALTTSGDTNTGMFFPAADTIALVEGGVEVIRINSSANVGIGTSSPGAKLAVVGTGYSPTITLTDGATLNWDTSLGQVAQVTLGGNRTFAAPTNLVNGGFYSLLIIQDGTGSRTISWNAVFDFAGGTAPTLSTAAGSKDLITWRSDGTNMLEVGRSLGVA